LPEEPFKTMNDLSRILFIFAGCFFLAGCLVYFFGKIPGLGRLPGDIIIKRENFTVYFPLATSIVLSLVLSLFLMIFKKR
jgi:hypothetical protein